MQIAAVLLAAGASRRFGGPNKLLASVDGVALVRRVATTLAAATVPATVVVTGRDADEIAAALSDLPGHVCIRNTRWNDGIGGSIAVGIRALADTPIDGALVVPGDLPALDPALVSRLMLEFEDRGARAIVYPAAADGTQRNPVLWPRRLFPRLVALVGDVGGKAIMEAERTAGPSSAFAVAWADGASFEDIDTPEALAGFLASRHPLG